MVFQYSKIWRLENYSQLKTNLKIVGGEKEKEEEERERKKSLIYCINEKQKIQKIEYIKNARIDKQKQSNTCVAVAVKRTLAHHFILCVTHSTDFQPKHDL